MKLWGSGGQEREKDTNAADESRILNFLDIFTLGLGSSLGFGIFVLVGHLVGNVAGPAAVVSVSLAGVAALVGGLCFSEFGVRFVKGNSAYSYSYLWGRENAAFIFGWTLILEYVAGSASAARGITTFIDALADHKISQFLKEVSATNFQDFFPYFDFFSLGIIILLTISIVFGLKDFLIVKKIFTVCNVVLVISVVTAAAFKADVSNWQTSEGQEGNWTDGFAPFGVLGVVKGAALAFYGFIGFDRVGVSGNEIHKQKRNLPATILLTILATYLAYAGVGTVLTLMLPYKKINSYAAVPFAFQEIGWPQAKWVIAVATFFGFQTSLFGAIFPLPKIIQTMANDGLLFPCLGDSHRKIPALATATGGLLAAAAAGIFTFQELANLTVIGALLAYTILSINVILLRYFPKPDDEGMLSDSWKNLISKNSDISMKAVMKNCFNFRVKHPTNLTGRIIMWNIILFCASSVGLGVLFNCFYISLSAYAPEIIAPVSVLLCVMLFNLISMICQPKSQEMTPFKVPLVPLLPCLSIFLNIFLMMTFKSVTWILFLSWMAVGILPHSLWRFVKCFRGEMGENSLYEINRTNAVKLNESIWKIKSDKKNFYEGAVNPVFSEDLDDRFHDMNGHIDVKTRSEKTALQLKQAEIIQTAEFVVEEKADPLTSELDLNYILVDREETANDLPDENGKVLWECVAEIHTEEEYPQENVALEIVDNTYNFLSEELSKDDVILYRGSGKESLSESEDFFRNTDNSDSLRSQQSEETPPGETKNELFKQKLTNNRLGMNKNNNDDAELQNEYSSDAEDTKETILNENSLVGDFPISRRNNLMEPEVKPPKSVLEEQNKVKQFKEKLNQLLKNHVHPDTSLIKNYPPSKPAEKDENDDDENNNENDKDAAFNSIKTLNKSQIKGRLELLLSKGPPKRASLRDSFNIKLKETDGEKDPEKGQDEKVQNGTTTNGDDAENQFAVQSSTLQDSIKEKILALKNVRSELPKDVCC